MKLILNLKKKVLKDEDYKFYYIFDNWSYQPDEKSYFLLDNLNIESEEIYEIVFEKEIAYISYEGDYNGADEVSHVFITSDIDHKYKEKVLTKALEDYINDQIYDTPLTGEKGEVKGSTSVYFDYDIEEFVFETFKISLNEDTKKVKDSAFSPIFSKYRKIIEQLVSYLNKLFEDFSLSTDYSEGKIALICDNELSKKEQSEVSNKAISFLKKRLNKEEMSRVNISKQFNSFYLEIDHEW